MEKKRLELEAEKVIIQKRELKLQELDCAEKRLQRLEATNEEDVEPQVWIMMQKQKKEVARIHIWLRVKDIFGYS
jgi:hypothetical protein